MTGCIFGTRTLIRNSQRVLHLRSSAISKTSCLTTGPNSTRQLHMPTQIPIRLLASKHAAPLEEFVYALLAAQLRINTNFNLLLQDLLWKLNSWRPAIQQKWSCSYVVCCRTSVFCKRLQICYTKTTMAAPQWAMLKNPHLALDILISNISCSANGWNVTLSSLTGLTHLSICPIILPRHSSQIYFTVMETFSSATFHQCIHQFISLPCETSPTTMLT